MSLHVKLTNGCKIVFSQLLGDERPHSPSLFFGGQFKVSNCLEVLLLQEDFFLSENK